MTRSNPVVAIDFDDTIVEWVEDGRCVLKKDVVASLRRLKEKGCTLVIHTCRVGIAREDGDLDEVLDLIRGVLDEFQVPYDSIHLGTKVVADAYIDDRAIAFRNNWKQALQDTEDLLAAKKKKEVI